MRGKETSSGRDTSRDGLRNRIEDALLTSGRPLWRLVNAAPWLARVVNKAIVDNAVAKAPFRPLALSTMADYTSWASLTDRSWFCRYLPPREPPSDLPPLESLRRLYVTRAGQPRMSTTSTLLFPSFAQWFTDGFLMTDPVDRRRTTTNHQIDLDQIYGPSAEATRALRSCCQDSGRRGRMISVERDGEEWAPFLFDKDGRRDPRFRAVPDPMKLPADLPAERKATIFAFGGERANATVFTAAINTLFLREHNRLSGIVENAHPDWDDERVFQTARNIGIAQLIRIVIEEYINHISPYWFRLLCDPTPSYRAEWNRQNWIPVEFNLLYRWHSLVPEFARWTDRDVPMAELRFCNTPLLRDGLGATLGAASRTPIWRLGLFNTPAELRDVEIASVRQGRENGLATYNDYRELMDYPRVERFEQISGDPAVVTALREIYGDVDRIEFFVGLFAEDAPERSAVPPLIGRMVAVDAFSHALTNPLLAPHVYSERTFTREGMASIAATSALVDIARRNCRAGAPRISMDAASHTATA